MKMPPALILLAAVACCGSVRAADPSSGAKTRADFYQREVRTALTEHHWLVSEDKPGELIATRPALTEGGPAGSFLLDVVAQLTINFQADSTSYTITDTHTTRYVYSDGSIGVRREVFAPRRMSNPKLNKDVQDIMAEAETQLAQARPEYAGHELSSWDKQEIARGRIAQK